MIVRELLTKIGFKTDQASVDRFDASIKSVTKSLAIMTTAATAASGAIFLLVKSAAATGDELDKVKDVIGLTVKQIQLLSGAAALSGVQHESFIRSMQFFSKAVGMARMGMMEQLRAFQMLGISIRGANGQVKSQIQLFTEVSDKLSKVKNVQDRAALSQILFSRSGGRMLNMFKNGSKGLKEMTDQVEQLGFIMDKKGVKQSADFTNQMFLAKFAVSSLKNEIGLKLMPVFSKMLTEFLNWVKLNKVEIVNNVTSAFRGLVEVTEVLGEAIRTMAGAFGGLFNILKSLNKSNHETLMFLGALTVAVWALASPLALITAGFAAILLVLDDVNAYAEGKDSLLGRFIKDFPEAAKAIKGTFEGIGWTIQHALIDPLEHLFTLLNDIRKAFAFGFKGIASLAQVGNINAPTGFGGFQNILSSGVNPLAGFTSYLPSMPHAFHVNTNVNVTVPAGSSASQQDFIATAAKGSFHDSLSNEIRKALTVFPGVEK